MPAICSTNTIKFSLVNLDAEEFQQILETSAEYDNYEGIVGFIRNGKFTHPYGVEEQDETHWSTEFCKAFPGDCLLVIEGPPSGVDSILETFIVMERDWYGAHNEFELWTTPVGNVAVC